jgi:hypothetical protein
MMGLIHPMVAACLVCGMLLARPAQAESGGRITFSGAIVVPTCATELSPEERAKPAGMLWVTCGGSDSSRAGRSSVAHYASSAVSLDKAWGAGNPLLDYFIKHAALAEETEAVLVTRVYE